MPAKATKPPDTRPRGRVPGESRPEFPAWINDLVGDAASKVFNEAKSALISKAQAALVEPLAERVGRAMASAEGVPYEANPWKTRAYVALAELAKRPGK